jgi:hypothetical protein
MFVRSVAELDHVDAINRRDRIDVLDTLRGLDQRDHHRARWPLRSCRPGPPE